VKQPNVLWISTHDINPHLGCYSGIWPGAEFAHTPNLDQLAAEGARFDNAFATAPVCAPSRSSIMTGCYPTSIGTMHMRTKAVPPPQVRLLPEYFRAAGYYTTNNFYTDFQVVVPPTVFDDCSATGHWRNRPSADTPFFAAFHGLITHESQIYLPDADFEGRTSHVTAEQRHDPEQAPVPPYHPDTAVFRQAWARYADLITEMDYTVGEILRELEQDGLAESTIVVFWSDHGVGMPRGKRWANESGLHEPLIIRWPGVIAPGTVRTDLVSLMDLAPTTLTTCGLPVPDHMQGHSFLTGDGTPAPPRPYAFGGRDRMDEQEDTTRTVRDDRYRYIRNYHPDRSPMQHCNYPDHLGTWSEMRTLAVQEGTQLARGERRSILTPLQRSLIAARKPEEELYDIVEDPHEQVNLAQDPQYAEVVDRLDTALSAWQQDVGDLGLIEEDQLIEDWRPGGQPHQTQTPTATAKNGELHLDCPTPGASIGWTTHETAPTATPDPMAEFLGVIADGRGWQVYTEPFTPAPDDRIFVKAWRIGYDPSAEISVTVEAPR